MRVLILGSGGKVGTLLRRVWPSSMDAVWHGRTSGDVSFDILTETTRLKAAIESCDAVINLAGATHHSGADVGSQNSDIALEVLDHAGDKPVFLFSSAAVYGRMAGPLTEDRVPEPVSDYGADKAMMEAACLKHPARAIVLRVGNIAGADALLGTKRERYSLDRFPDGNTPIRSYIGPGTLSRVLVALLEKAETLPPILNISCPHPVQMSALLDAAGLPWQAKAPSDTAIPSVVLDTAKLLSYVSFDQGSDTAEAIVADWRQAKEAR